APALLDRVNRCHRRARYRPRPRSGHGGASPAQVQADPLLQTLEGGRVANRAIDADVDLAVASGPGQLLDQRPLVVGQRHDLTAGVAQFELAPEVQILADRRAVVLGLAGIVEL